MFAMESWGAPKGSPLGLALVALGYEVARLGDAEWGKNDMLLIVRECYPVERRVARKCPEVGAEPVRVKPGEVVPVVVGGEVIVVREERAIVAGGPETRPDRGRLVRPVFCPNGAPKGIDRRKGAEPKG